MELLTSIIIACLGSSALSSLIIYLIQRKDKKDDNHKDEGKLLLGLCYDKIVFLCNKYISKGYIAENEYHDLIRYFYEPYKELGGDGTAEKLIEEVKKLPSKPNKIDFY